MYCQECGQENQAGARYCSHCGTRLSLPRKVCSYCQRDNPEDARFCAHCGADLDVSGQEAPPPIKRKAERLKRRVMPGGRWSPAVVGLALIGGVLVLVFAMENFLSLESPPKQKLVEQKSNDPAVEAKVVEVASKFICGCGSCGEQPLDTCTCNAAIQERRLIRDYVSAGQTVEQIILAVNDNFGWMKPEFATKYGGQSSRPTLPDRPISAFDEFGPKSDQRSVNLATQADRLEIFSQFKCPCGQCGIEELKDCECSHPRGAREVKAFVDEKISTGRHSIAQVVALLDDRYGHKKSQN